MMFQPGQMRANALADELGLLQAQIAILREREAALKAELLSLGCQAAEGNLYKATIVKAMRETLIAEKVREYLHPNQLRHCIRVAETVAVRVTARNGKSSTQPNGGDT